MGKKTIFIVLLVTVLTMMLFMLIGKKKFIPSVENDTVPIPDEQIDTALFSEIPDDSTHIRFKGVPVDGSLRLFVARMNRKGFKLCPAQDLGSNIIKSVSSVSADDVILHPEDREAWLIGDFASFKECYLHVSTLENKDLVSSITVSFPSVSTWTELHSVYSELKELLTEKYGKPVSVTETFQGYRSPFEDDNDKFSKACRNLCRYESIFKLSNGTITLWINEGYVSLLYQDKINSDSYRQNAINDL